MRIDEAERLLGEMIAAAKDRNLGWCEGANFKANGFVSTMEQATHCCAMGAIHLAGKDVPWKDSVTHGNDLLRWSVCLDDDNLEALGYAFKCAMEDDK